HLPPFSCLFIAPSPPQIYTLSLHDALPISPARRCRRRSTSLRASASPSRTAFHEERILACSKAAAGGGCVDRVRRTAGRLCEHADRKSTRLNSSHVKISYAVFCLKKKNNR